MSRSEAQARKDLIESKYENTDWCKFNSTAQKRILLEPQVVAALKEKGYINLGVIEPDLPTQDIVNMIGPTEHIPGLSLVQKLSPKTSSEYPRNTYSGNFGLNDFPLHTDLAHWKVPPRYLLLRCIVPDPSVKTFMINGRNITDSLSPEIVSRALFAPRRPLDGKLFLLRFYSDGIIRWDSTFVVPKNDAAQILAEKIKEIELQSLPNIALEQKGQILLIDNWNILHGRQAIKNLKTDRLIERVYLSGVFT
jgi:hypothetical protein